MKFLSLRAQNFMSFREFDLVFPPAGLVFVGGKISGSEMSNSNGAGKSAIFEALCWGLYGQSLRSSGKDDVVNYKAKKNCWVEVIFEGDDGTPYILTRYRNHREKGNSLVLLRLDKDITGSDARATQATVDGILKMNWLVFSTAVVFGEKAQRFTEAKDAEKKEIFDEILMFQAYQEALRKAKEDRAASDIKQASAEAKLNIANEGLSKSAERLEAARQRYAAWIETRDAKKIEIEAAVGRMEELKPVIDADRAELDRAEAALAGLAALRHDVSEISERRWKDKERAMAEFVPLIMASANRVAISENELRSLKRYRPGQAAGTRCPVCRQPVTEATITEVTAHVTSEIERVAKELAAAQVECAEVDAEKRKVETEFQARVNEVNEQLKAIDKGIDDDTKQKAAIVGRVHANEMEYTTLKESVKGALDHIGKMEAEVDAEMVRLKKDIASYERDKANAAVEAETAKDERRYINFWVDGFGNQGIKSFLLDDIIPALTARANYYASVLMDGATQIVFSTESTLKSGDVRDKFDVKVSVGGQQVDYKTMSSGEKRRVDVAVLLALQGLIFERSAGSCNVIAFDEVFDSLDATGIEKTIGLLQEEAREKTIFVISHSQEFADYFDTVLTVEKRNGVSSISAEAGA